MDLLENNNLEERQTGTSLGNEWIACKSKKRNNQTYYFNTVTGQSVWNLSEAHSQRANSGNQISGELPGPTEPPTGYNVKTSMTQMDNMQHVLSIPPSDYRFVKPPPVLISTLGVPQLSMLPFDNIVWDRPPPNYPYPMLAVPPTPPQLSSVQNDKNDIVVQNTEIPLSQRFQNINYQSRIPAFMSTLDEGTFGETYKVQPQHRLKHNIGLDDLRLKLSAKRKIQDVQRTTAVLHKEDSCEIKIERAMHRLNVTDGVKKAPVIFSNFTVTKPEPEVIVGPRCLEIYKDISDKDDEIWLAENMDSDDNKSLLDTTPLQTMAPYDAIAEHWYIMADTNVYIMNFKFLNILINSDDRCLLLVSETVIKELRWITAAKGIDKNLQDFATQAIAFISQLLASGKAIKDKDMLRTIIRGAVVCPIGDDQIINCCLRIAENKFHVILLSNDKLLERKTSTTSLPIFTVDRVKELLASYRKEKIRQNDDKEIFITIKNNEGNRNRDEAQDNSDSETNNVKERQLYTELTKQYDAYEEDPNDKNLYVPSPPYENESSGHTEAHRYMPTSPESSRVESPVDNVSQTKSTKTNVVTSENESCTSGSTKVKTRIIRLKRKTDLRRSPRRDVKKTTIKWRRRPLTKATPNKEENSDKPTSSNKEVPKENETSPGQTKISPKQSMDRTKHLLEIRHLQTETLQKNIHSPQESDDLASSIGDASCSSVIHSKEPNKIIDESSNTSSDVINNSRSSVNSDKPKLNLSNYTRRRTLDSSSISNAMDKTMADNLRQGCEEWVSLFQQIMEEALTQVLLYAKTPIEEGKFLPLNIHEATDLVKKRFCHHVEVFHAASRLAERLLQVKDSRESIRRSLNPQDYMELFRCGESLAGSLLKVLPNCEDIRTCVRMLVELLNDIKVPKSFNESLSHNENCTTAIARTNVYSAENVNPPANVNSQVNFNLEPHSPEDYQAPVKTTFVRIAPKGLELLFGQNKKTKPSRFGQELKISDAMKSSNVKNPNEEANKSGQKISFKFNIDPVFEDRLKAKKLLDTVKLDCSVQRTSDLSEGEIDEEMDYEDAGSCDLDECEEMDDTKYHDHVDDEVEEAINESEGEVKYNEHLASFIKIFMKEIKDTFLHVHGFCKDTYSELSLGNVSVSRIQEIETQAQDAYITMEKILGHLNKILERESNDTESNIKSLVQNSFGGRQLSTYKDVILKCADQAKVLMDALNSIKNLNSNL